MTYKNLVDRLEEIIDAHYFINTRGYGNISDIEVPENEEPPNYPYAFINPVDMAYTRNSFTWNFNLILMTQVNDSQTDDLSGQDSMVQIISDVVSQFLLTTNDPLIDVVVPFTITPFKERFQDDVVGATANITMTYAKAIDGCDTPFSPIPVPSGSSCPYATITDGDGSIHFVDAGGDYTCLPATAKAGIFYQRAIPWENNDPGVVGSVYYHTQNGTYDYTPPTNPLYISALPNDYAGTDANCLLLQLNRYGNYYKYTNDVGEQYTEGFAESLSNTSPNKRLCIDHFTGLAYYVQDAVIDRVLRTFSQACAYAEAFTYAGFSDWRLVDIGTYLSSVMYNDYVNSYPPVYCPFVDPLIRNYGGAFWTGTFSKDNAYVYIVTNGSTIGLTTNPAVTINHLMMVRTQLPE